MQDADFCRQTAYDDRKRDPDFATAWENVLEEYADKLEEEADRRAVKGVDEPIFYKGKVCGYRRRYSDTLLIFRLKALRPERYRERSENRVVGNLNLHADRSIEELIAIAQGGR